MAAAGAFPAESRTELRPAVLIDLSAIFRAAWHASEHEPSSVAFEATLAGVKRAAAVTDGNPLVAVCCDGRGNWRKQIAPEYKAHRDKAPEAMYGLFDKVKRRLADDGYLLWEFAGFEADDVIATACAQLKGAGHSVTIATADKDLIQLLGDDVDILSTKTWERMDAAAAIGKWGVRPDQFADWLSLVGDSSDGIKGCPGVGPKRATELIARFGTLRELMDTVAGIADGSLSITPGDVATPAIFKALSEHRASIELARQLITLKGVPDLKIADIYEERKAKPLDRKLDAMEVDADLYFGEQGANETSAAALPARSSPGESLSATRPAVEPKSRALSSADETQDKAEQKEVARPEQPSTALTTVEYSKQLEPRSFSQVLQLSNYLYESRLFGQFKNPEAIAAIIMRGREMGLGGATALSTFHVVEGRPCAYAYLIIARAKADPDCEYLYCVEASPTSATWETKNRNNPGPSRVTYTIEQARAAGLVKPNSAWEKNPEDLLVKSAGVKLARREYPAAALGLYSVEEMGGE